MCPLPIKGKKERSVRENQMPACSSFRRKCLQHQSPPLLHPPCMSYSHTGGKQGADRRCCIRRHSRRTSGTPGRGRPAGTTCSPGVDWLFQIIFFFVSIIRAAPPKVWIQTLHEKGTTVYCNKCIFIWHARWLQGKSTIFFCLIWAAWCKDWLPDYSIEEWWVCLG